MTSRTARTTASPRTQRRGIGGTERRRGTFYTACRIENPTQRSRTLEVPKLLVDTGSEYTWLPQPVLDRVGIGREKKDVKFVLANGQEITRSVGFAIVRVQDAFTIDEIVFGQEGDLSLLGARTLEGLNLTVNARRKWLEPGGPLPAAGLMRGAR